MITKYQVVILGAGLSGILLARKLKTDGVDFIVLEKEVGVGGLSRTISFAGRMGDFGPHAIYSRNPETIDFFKKLPIDYEKHVRNVKICHHGSNGQIYELEYPFENGIGDLSLEDKTDCLLGYFCAFNKKRKRFNHLLDWIKNGLGDGIAKYFMIPYNQKIWNCPLSKISMDLVSKKIDPASLKTVIEVALGKKTIGRKYQHKFLYPRDGIGNLAKVLAGPLKNQIFPNHQVKKIKFRRSRIEIICNNNTKFVAQKVISTMPLVELIKMTPQAQLRKYLRLLKFNDTYFYLIGLKEGKNFRRFKDCHWVFFAGPEIFYRFSMPHNFNPRGKISLVVEVTKKGLATRMTTAERKQRVIKDLLQNGVLAKANNVEIMDERLVRYTYPIPSLGLTALKKKIDRVFKKKNIYLLGRSGHWDYINMDQVVEKVNDFYDENKFELCP